MRGSWNVWSLDVTEVHRRDSNIVVTGRYTEGFLAENWIPFTITMDEQGNVIEAKTRE